MPDAMTRLILLGILSLKPSVKVSVEPSVEGYARGRFGKVRSSDKTIAIIDDNLYI
jgi:hypothetical protein